MRTALSPMTSVLQEAEKEKKQRDREEGRVMMEAETGGLKLQVREAGDH